MMLEPATSGRSRYCREPLSEFASIGDMRRRLGATTRALRYYEERRLISPRRVGDTRLYSPSDQAQLRDIVAWRKLGVPILDIASILEHPAGSDLRLVAMAQAFREHTVRLAQRKGELNEAIEKLRLASERLGGDNSARTTPDLHPTALRHNLVRAFDHFLG